MLFIMKSSKSQLILFMVRSFKEFTGASEWKAQTSNCLVVIDNIFVRLMTDRHILKNQLEHMALCEQKYEFMFQRDHNPKPDTFSMHWLTSYLLFLLGKSLHKSTSYLSKYTCLAMLLKRKGKPL